MSTEKSKSALASTNSITILNKACIEFSGLNFSNTKLCGSNLSGAISHKTNY